MGLKTLVRKVTNYNDKNSFGSKLRAKRIAPLLEIIQNVYAEHGRVDIIDIGGLDSYWNIIPDDFLDNHKVSITIVNIPGSELPEDYGRYKFICGDGCDLQGIADDAFHIAHSNSVLEHVGDWDRMVAFANEVLRVSRKHFVQTPNFWFLMEPHCMTPLFHWLPRPTRVWLVLNFSLGHWSKATTVDDAVRMVDSARLLNHRMMQALFRDSELVIERLFLLPKSLIMIKK